MPNWLHKDLHGHTESVLGVRCVGVEGGGTEAKDARAELPFRERDPHWALRRIVTVRVGNYGATAELADKSRQEQAGIHAQAGAASTTTDTTPAPSIVSGEQVELNSSASFFSVGNTSKLRPRGRATSTSVARTFRPVGTGAANDTAGVGDRGGRPGLPASAALRRTPTPP